MRRRHNSEHEDGEDVLELFLDVILCGFGAALALVMIYSVLPKSGLFGSGVTTATSTDLENDPATNFTTSGDTLGQPLLFVEIEDPGNAKWMVHGMSAESNSISASKFRKWNLAAQPQFQPQTKPTPISTRFTTAGIMPSGGSSAPIDLCTDKNIADLDPDTAFTIFYNGTEQQFTFSQILKEQVVTTIGYPKENPVLRIKVLDTKKFRVDVLKREGAP